MILLAAFLGLVSGLWAQPQQRTPEQAATDFSSKLVTDLGISADQKTKVHDIALTRVTKLRELKSKYKSGDSKLTSESKTVRDDFQAKLKSILTADQYTKYEKLKAERKAKGPGANGGKAPAGKSGEKMKADTSKMKDKMPPPSDVDEPGLE